MTPDVTVRAVIVYHHGTHTCVCKPRATLDALMTAHPSLTPLEASNAQLLDYFLRRDVEFSWTEMSSIVESTLDTQRLHYARRRRTSDQEPCGGNFDGLALVKARTDQKDKFLMYRLNSRAMSNQPTHVFTYSRKMAELALAMDRNSAGAM